VLLILTFLTESKKWCKGSAFRLLRVVFFLGLLLIPEDAGSMFLRIVSFISPHYMALNAAR
jgi:hypothetical protein